MTEPNTTNNQYSVRDEAHLDVPHTRTKEVADQWIDPLDRPETYLDGQEERTQAQAQARRAPIDLETERQAMGRSFKTVRTPPTSPVRQTVAERSVNEAEGRPGTASPQTEDKVPGATNQRPKGRDQEKEATVGTLESPAKDASGLSCGDRARELFGVRRSQSSPRLKSTEDRGESEDFSIIMPPPPTTQIPRGKTAPGKDPAERTSPTIDLTGPEDDVERGRPRTRQSCREERNLSQQSLIATDHESEQETGSMADDEQSDHGRAQMQKRKRGLEVEAVDVYMASNRKKAKPLAKTRNEQTSPTQQSPGDSKNKEERRRAKAIQTLQETANNPDAVKMSDLELIELLAHRPVNEAKAILQVILTRDREHREEIEKLRQEVQELKEASGRQRTITEATGQHQAEATKQPTELDIPELKAGLTKLIEEKFTSLIEQLGLSGDTNMSVKSATDKPKKGTQKTPLPQRDDAVSPAPPKSQLQTKPTGQAKHEGAGNPGPGYASDATTKDPNQMAQTPPEAWATKETRHRNKPATKGGIRALHAMIPDLQKRANHPTWARITARSTTTGTIDTLQKTYDPSKEGIEIAKALRQPGSKQLLVRTETEQDLDRLYSSKALHDQGYQVERLTAKLPKLIVYDVDASLSREQLVEEAAAKNDCIRSASDADFRPLFKIQKKSKAQVHWIVEVSAGIRRSLVSSQGKKLKIMWARLRVDDYLDAPRCFNCQRYGHVSKHCPHRTTTCGHCGAAGHRYKDCLSRDEPPVCTPCKIAGADFDHEVHHKSCPSKLRAIKERMRNTNYAS